MSRKVLAVVLAVSMILGVFSLAAAQGQGGSDEAPRPGPGAPGPGQTVRAGEQHTEGQPTVTDAVYGPPEFVESMHRHNLRHTFMHQHQVLVNGHPLESDLPPVIIDGRIRIPVRAVCVALQAEVKWDAENRVVTITRGDNTVVIKIDEETILVNGEEFEMDVPAQIFAGRTFVPLRFIALALGDDVEWDQELKTARVRSLWPAVEDDEKENEEDENDNGEDEDEDEDEDENDVGNENGGNGEEE